MACYFGCGTRNNKISWVALVVLIIVGGIIFSSGISLVFRDFRRCSDRKQLDYRQHNNSTLPLSNAQTQCREQANKNPNSVWSNTSRGLVLLGFLTLIILAPIPCYFFCCCSKPPDPMAVLHAAYPVAPMMGEPVMGTLAGGSMAGLSGGLATGGGMAGLANGLVTTGGMPAAGARVGPQATYINMPVGTGEPVTGVQVQPLQSPNGHYGQFGGGMSRDTAQGVAPMAAHQVSAGYGGHYPEGGVAYPVTSQPYSQTTNFQPQYTGGAYIANSSSEQPAGMSHGAHATPPAHQQTYLQGLPVDEEDVDAYYRAGPNPIVSVLAGNSGSNSIHSSVGQGNPGGRDWQGHGHGGGSADAGDSARTGRLGHIEVPEAHGMNVEMGPYKGSSR